MKRPLRSVIYIFGVLILFSFVVACNGNEEDGFVENATPAVFNFDNHLATKWNTKSTVGVTVYSDALQKLEVKINDSVVQSWTQPDSGLVEFELNTSFLTVGAFHLDLLSTSKDGSQFVDNRVLRILSDLKPENWSVEILSEYPHNTQSFTQGLEFSDGVLYEGTGQRGESKVAQINVQSGAIEKKISLGASHFGEGITVLGDTLYQLTWTSGRCFLYDKNTLNPLQEEFEYSGEGWGICNNGKSLIISDGSEKLTFRNPSTFAIEKTVEVYTDQDAIPNLNELEYIDGLVFANVWMTNMIAVIDPESGRVLAQIDGSELVRKGRGKVGEAFNGIAYNKLENILYLTGKRWEKLFAVRVNKSVS